MTKDEIWTGLKEFPIPGRLFRLLETVSAVDVKAYAADGRVLCDEKGVEAGYWIDRANREIFSRIEITTSGAERVKFIITDGLSGTDSVPSDIISDATRLLGIVYGSLGQLAQVLVNAVNYLRVQVQGRGDAETDAGNAFVGYASRVAVAAQYSHVQLFNEAASGKTLYVDSITGYPSAAAGLLVTFHNTALTDVAAWGNKESGGAAGASHLRTATNAAIQGTQICIDGVAVAEARKIEFDPPLKLGAGEGVCVVCGVVNVTLQVAFQGREY